MDFFRGVEHGFLKAFRISRPDIPPDAEFRPSEFKAGVADRIGIRKESSGRSQKEKGERRELHFPFSQTMSLA